MRGESGEVKLMGGGRGTEYGEVIRASCGVGECQHGTVLLIVDSVVRRVVGDCVKKKMCMKGKYESRMDCESRWEDV